MKNLNVELLSKTLDDRTLGEVAEGKVGGASVAVTQNGKLVYKNHFGLQNIEKNIPVTDNTVFRLASMTKPVTAVAAVTEMDRGHLDLFDPVEKYLPKYGELYLGKTDDNGVIIKTEKVKTKLRLIHLLTHSSGIGCAELGEKEMSLFAKDPRRDNLRTAVDAYPEFPLAFEPYTSQAYSPVWAWDVVGRIIEEVSGKSFSDYLESEIFKPLGMKDTTFYPTSAQNDRMIFMHNRDENGKSFAAPTSEGCVFGDFKYASTLGGAGLAGTMADYLNFCEMLLNEGNFRGNQLVRPEMIRSMGIPHIPETIMGPCNIWGLGMRVMDDDSHEAFPKGVYGWAGEFGKHFWIDPANKITAVYMKNSVYDGAFGVSVSQFEKDVYACIEK